MNGVFISYRRDDSQGWAARLADDLGEQLGPDLVFSDIEIPIGSDFATVLRRAIAACDVLLVVIERRWAATEGGISRLDDARDWVRIEIESALALAKPVIAVPMAGTPLPLADALPASLRPMLRLQAAPMNDRHWDADVARLADRLRAMMPSYTSARSGKAADGDAARHAPSSDARDSRAEVPREHAEQARRGRYGPVHTPPAPAHGWLHGLGRAVARFVWRLLGFALVLVLIHAGVRVFGDAAFNRQLDGLEGRAQDAIAHAWRRWGWH